MRKCLALGVLCLALCATAYAASPGSPLPADEALLLLKEGNARHVSGTPVHTLSGADYRVAAAKGWQRPAATVLACSDQITPVASLFDQGPGGLFVIQVAGGLAGPSELASLEYGVARLGTPVVLVLGHDDCGLMDAALQYEKLPGQAALIAAQLKPAVAKAREWSPTASGQDLLHKSVKAGVWQTMETVLRKSPLVRDRVQNGQALLLGAILTSSTGQVAWLGQHPEQGKILAAVHAALHKPRPRPKPKAPVADEAKSEEQGAATAEAPRHEADKAEPAPAHGKVETFAPDPKPTAKAAAKQAAKGAPKAEAATTEANPNARSQGEGELLLPEPEKAPAKAKTAGAKAAHQ